MTNRYEYVIWGIPPQQNEETLLFAGYNGDPVTDKKDILRVKRILESDHNCTGCRIQTIDMLKSSTEIAEDWKKLS